MHTKPIMRVLHTLNYARRLSAGPSYSVPQLCRSLGRAGACATLMTLDEEPLQDSPGFRHLTYREDAFPKKIAPSRHMESALALEAQSADLLHTHSMWQMPNIYPGRIARRQPIPLVTAPRGCLSASALAKSKWKKRVVWQVLQRVSFDHAACFHATSEKEYDEIRAFGLSAPVAVIPNGIDIPSLRPSTSAHDVRTLLFLGRIHPIKGLALLMEVWRDLPAAVRTGWQLKIVGPNEDRHRDTLEAMRKQFGLTDVHFSDALQDKAKTQAYRDADAYILPTLTENFGMTIAEALAAGTPVITTTGAPWKGLLEHDCGWWVDRTHSGLTAALKQTLSLPSDTLVEMGARGRSWMAAEFGWDGLAQQMLAVYEWLLSGQRGEVPATVRLT